MIKPYKTGVIAMVPVIVSFVILAIVVVGYIAMDVEFGKKDEIEDEIEMEGEHADWKTYVSEPFGFKISYPNYLLVDEGTYYSKSGELAFGMSIYELRPIIGKGFDETVFDVRLNIKASQY